MMTSCVANNDDDCTGDGVPNAERSKRKQKKRYKWRCTKIIIIIKARTRIRTGAGATQQTQDLMKTNRELFLNDYEEV
jgi:hypothetical protein